MMHDGWSSGWTMWGMWLAMIAFWLVPLVVVVGIFWLILGRDRKRGERPADPVDFDENRRALAILKERYARGEISRDEYERIKDDILSS
ncbi:SHOCT domain-containing protein [Thermaerobacter marianensis]|nr:SHOCT domain-containing protein [Thermaerobacter marianensis]